MVVRVLIVSCQASLKPKIGPLKAQASTTSSTAVNAKGRPAARAVPREKRWKNPGPLAMPERPIEGTMVSTGPWRASPIPTYRTASIAVGAPALVVLLAYFGLTWDAHLTNFQVRWMCDEDRAFVLRRGENADALAIPDEALRGDPRVAQLYAEAFPSIVAASSAEGRAARYALVDNWPKRIRSYWGYTVVRSELSVVERPGSRSMGTSGLYRRVPIADAPLAGLRDRVSPRAELCTPADRVEFVKRVLRPPG